MFATHFLISFKERMCFSICTMYTWNESEIKTLITIF